MQSLNLRHAQLGCCPAHTCSAGCDCACAFAGGSNGGDSDKAIARVERMVDELKKSEEDK